MSSCRPRSCRRPRLSLVGHRRPLQPLDLRRQPPDLRRELDPAVRGSEPALDFEPVQLPGQSRDRLGPGLAPHRSGEPGLRLPAGRLGPAVSTAEMGVGADAGRQRPGALGATARTARRLRPFAARFRRSRSRAFARLSSSLAMAASDGPPAAFWGSPERRRSVPGHRSAGRRRDALLGALRAPGRVAPGSLSSRPIDPGSGDSTPPPASGSGEATGPSAAPAARGHTRGRSRGGARRRPRLPGPAPPARRCRFLTRGRPARRRGAVRPYRDAPRGAVALLGLPRRHPDAQRQDRDSGCRNTRASRRRGRPLPGRQLLDQVEPTCSACSQRRASPAPSSCPSTARRQIVAPRAAARDRQRSHDLLALRRDRSANTPSTVAQRVTSGAAGRPCRIATARRPAPRDMSSSGFVAASSSSLVMAQLHTLGGSGA